MTVLTSRNASGYFEALDGWGKKQSGETLTCVHCQASWILQKGSGKVRGFCTNCMGYHCGGPACWECVPFERRLDNIEAGRPELTPAPVSVFVPGLDVG